MVTFLILAGVLLIAGVTVIAVPLLRKMPTQLAPATWTALGAAAVMVIGSAVLYAVFTNWSWRAAPAADSPQTMVAHLARKLESNPDDMNGWLMLGRSYIVLEQYPLALRSFQRADRLAGGKSAEALVGEAESLTMNDEKELDGRAGRLIEQALALDPNSGKALFFGAAAAVRRGELALGKERFQKLLSLNPPEQIRPILEQQIAAIDQRLGSNGGTGTVAAAGAAPAAAVKGAAVRVHIDLSPQMSKVAPDDAAPTRPAISGETTREPVSPDCGTDTSGFHGARPCILRRAKSAGGCEDCTFRQSLSRQRGSIRRNRLFRRSRRSRQHCDRPRHALEIRARTTHPAARRRGPMSKG
jgi:cytochrome c-type biogenesis protein CcmH